MKLLVKRILSHIPTPIPVKMIQFNEWLDSIVELCGPIADADSMKWVISNEIMRLPSGKFRVSKNLFVKILKKYAANQFAAATVMDLKMKQEQVAKAAAEAQQAEVTALQQASDEKQENRS